MEPKHRKSYVSGKVNSFKIFGNSKANAVCTRILINWPSGSGLLLNLVANGPRLPEPMNSGEDVFQISPSKAGLTKYLFYAYGKSDEGGTSVIQSHM